MDEDIYKKTKVVKLPNGDDRLAFILTKDRMMIYEDDRSNDRYKYLMILEDKEYTICNILVFDMENGDLYDAVASYISESMVETLIDDYVGDEVERVVYKVRNTNSNMSTIYNDGDDGPSDLCLAWNVEHKGIPTFNDLTLEDKRQLIELMEAEGLIL